MNTPFRAMRRLSGLAVVMLLQGCATLADLPGEVSHGVQANPPLAEAGGHSRTQREAILQTQWSGRKYQALVEAYGPPRMLMYIPGDRPGESVAVYGVRDRTSGCVDAFLLFHGSMHTALSEESVVTQYVCR